MNRKNAEEDSCDDCDSSGAQEALMPFLRPSIADPDDDWARVIACSYEEKLNIIQHATTTEIPPPMAATGAAVDNDNHSDANAFGTAMLAEFKQYLADGLEWEYYCAVINFLAFAKWSDLQVFEMIGGSDEYDVNDNLVIRCQAMLDAAVGAGYIEDTPKFHIFSAEKIEIRLFPYAHLIAIFLKAANIRSDEPRILENLLFTVFHEVGHYLFWYASVEKPKGRSGADHTEVPKVEAWARANLGTSGASVDGESYRKFEEVFCDRVGIAFGGSGSAHALANAIIGALPSPLEDGYWRVRLISLLKGVKLLHRTGYKNLFASINEDLPEDFQIAREEIDDLSEPYVNLLDDSVMQAFMSSFVGANPNGQAAAVQDPKAPDQLIADFKTQWSAYPPLIEFPYEWFAVIQAFGWGNRPTKNNIGT